MCTFSNLSCYSWRLSKFFFISSQKDLFAEVWCRILCLLCRHGVLQLFNFIRSNSNTYAINYPEEWMNGWMNESIFHNSKLQNQLLKVSVKFKTHFLQLTNMRLLLTANKLTGSNTYFDVSYRKHFLTNWFFQRSLVC